MNNSRSESREHAVQQLKRLLAEGRPAPRRMHVYEPMERGPGVMFEFKVFRNDRGEYEVEE